MRSLDAPGGDEHRYRPAAPGPRGLVGALLKFQGLGRMPPLSQHVPPWGPRDSSSHAEGGWVPSSGSQSQCRLGGAGAHREAAVLRTRGPLERVSPKGPDLCLQPHPHPSAHLVSPTQRRGPKITFSVSQWLWLQADWSRGGRVSHGSSHTFLSCVHLYF